MKTFLRIHAVRGLLLSSALVLAGCSDLLFNDPEVPPAGLAVQLSYSALAAVGAGQVDVLEVSLTSRDTGERTDAGPFQLALAETQVRIPVPMSSDRESFFTDFTVFRDGEPFMVAYDTVVMTRGEVTTVTPSLTTIGGPVLGTGDVQITLTWSGTNDLDLWVTDPLGERIDFTNPTSASGGTLDVDDTDGFGPENVFWPVGGAPGGEYRVQINNFDGGTTGYTVRVRSQGQEKSYGGTINTNETVDVVRFTLGSPLPTSAASLSPTPSVVVSKR